MASGPSTTGATAGSPTPPPIALPLRLCDLDVATGERLPPEPPPPIIFEVEPDEPDAPAGWFAAAQRAAAR